MVHPFKITLMLNITLLLNGLCLMLVIGPIASCGRVCSEEAVRVTLRIQSGDLHRCGQSAIPVVRSILRNQQEALPLRIQAALALVDAKLDRQSAAQALPELRAILRNKRDNLALRQTIAEVLGYQNTTPPDALFFTSEFGLRAQEAVVDLAVVLSDRNDNLALRKTVAETLTQLGPDAGSAVSALRSVLCDSADDLTLRRMTAATLESIGASAASAVPELQGVLRNEQYNLPFRIQAARTLGAIGPAAAEATSDLLQVVSNPTHDFRLRSHAVHAVGRIGLPAEALPIFAAVLRNKQENPELRRSVTETLAQTGATVQNALPDDVSRP